MPEADVATSAGRFEMFPKANIRVKTKDGYKGSSVLDRVPWIESQSALARVSSEGGADEKPTFHFSKAVTPNPSQMLELVVRE